MSKRKLTEEETHINNVVHKLLYKRVMPNASAFIEGIKAFNGLKLVEVVTYCLYFKYRVGTENQKSWMLSEITGSHSIVAKTKKPLNKIAESFNNMNEDEQLAILTQLFPRDFEFDGVNAIIGLDSEDSGDGKIFQAVVKKLTNYKYV